MIKRGEKAQSEIISSILLVLLVIAAVVVVIGIVMNLIQNKEHDIKCVDVLGKIEISDGYTCYNTDASPKEMQVQVHVSNIAQSIDGFVIEVGGASTNSYKIENSSTLAGVKMCNQSAVLYLPNNNEERTYVITSTDKPDLVRVHPVLKGGNLCQASDSVSEIRECIISSKKCTP
jgi:flagellin-like protein